MKIRYAALALPALLACTPAAQTGAGATAAVEAVPLSGAMIPAGTMITVELDQPVGGNVATFHVTPLTATVVDAVRTSAGATMIEAGATLEGAVTGYYEGGGSLPEMVSLEFTRINFGAMTHEITSEVVRVDMALGDNDATTPAPTGALAGTPPAHVHGAVIENAEEFLRENELGEVQGSVISLGTGSGAALPIGTRLTVRLATDLPI
jgi:hypothetical protein